VCRNKPPGHFAGLSRLKFYFVNSSVRRLAQEKPTKAKHQPICIRLRFSYSPVRKILQRAGKIFRKFLPVALSKASAF